MANHASIVDSLNLGVALEGLARRATFSVLRDKASYASCASILRILCVSVAPSLVKPVRNWA